MGLGNPGERYRRTRHNLGYRVVDSFSRSVGAGKPFRLRDSRCAAAVHSSQRILLVKPLTYMNLSGRAVLELIHRYHLHPGQLVVVCDDLDLPPGSIRLRTDGSSGGHRGVQSIIEAVGTTVFTRLRLGIGKPDFGDAATHVLEMPSPPERELLEAAVARAVEALDLYLEQGPEEAMNRFNRSP